MRTREKYAGSRNGSSTPRQLRSAKSTSPTVPSSKVSWSRKSPTTSTATMSCSSSTGTRLGQRIDLLKRLFAPRSLPVVLELVTVLSCPFSHKRECSPGKRARDHGAIEIDRRCLTRVPCVEVRSGMVALVPVHGDHDAVEAADSGHEFTVRVRSAVREPTRPVARTGSRRLPGAWLLPAELPLAPRMEGQPRSDCARRDLTEVWRRAADVLKIPAMWLVHAARERPATSVATSFRRVDVRRDW